MEERSIPDRFRNSRSQMFFKTGVLKNFADFTGKHLCWTPTQAFCCEICEIFKNTYFCRTPPVPASVN